MKKPFLKFRLSELTQSSNWHKFCECASYAIGDRRCECGNRRIEISVDGDCMNGYYISASPY